MIVRHRLPRYRIGVNATVTSHSRAIKRNRIPENNRKTIAQMAQSRDNPTKDKRRLKVSKHTCFMSEVQLQGLLDRNGHHKVVMKRDIALKL